MAHALAARGYGVLEPAQSARSVSGQVRELKEVLERHGSPPLAVIGWSWGAWLACLLAADSPTLVSRVILVGSGPFTPEYAATILPTRLSRLTAADARFLKTCLENNDMGGPASQARIMALLAACDTWRAIPQAEAEADFDPAIYESVWPQAAELRRSGELLRLTGTIRCPIVAIHGDYDPHPAAGVEEPLRAVARDFRFVPLPRCGHRPWVEQEARDIFYRELERALTG
ncbi:MULTISPECIES: alpha/beta fold hydrolase [unclassified Xanthobacter]|uniref:alpha/beta fold hydrolase n=1 Tax=unclassified Xanthobacter TaxID=2623496 RepID=UPI001F235F4E